MSEEDHRNSPPGTMAAGEEDRGLESWWRCSVWSWGVKGVMGYLWLREECGENVFHTLEW